MQTAIEIMNNLDNSIKRVEKFFIDTGLVQTTELKVANMLFGPRIVQTAQKDGTLKTEWRLCQIGDNGRMLTWDKLSLKEKNVLALGLPAMFALLATSSKQDFEQATANITAIDEFFKPKIEHWLIEGHVPVMSDDERSLYINEQPSGA